MADVEFLSNKILIDRYHRNKTAKSYNDAEYRQFQRQKKLVDPKYLERDIEYRFNDEGYRTKNIDELDQDFVLVFGCSHTEGIGNFEEDIWCSQLLSRLGIDFLNLGKAGTGSDIQYLNSMQWINNDYPMPKAVIYQWPQTFRKSFAYKYKKSIELRHHNVNTGMEKRDTAWYLKRYCVDAGEMLINNFSNYHSSNLLWNSHRVPVLNWSWTGDFDYDFENLHMIETEDTGRARDLMHDGSDIHKQVADQLLPLVDRLL